MKINSGVKKSFWDLYKENTILIPQIQRDYIQGRKNKQVQRNLENFINDLFDSLTKNKELTLNFIYGYYNNNCFVPIDGQQRLTTLFLLHIYLFAKEGKIEELKINNKLNFSYKTRPQTDRFFEALIDNLKYENIFRNETKVDFVSYIQNQSWYLYEWNSDPSVISCLTTLSVINKVYTNLVELYKQEKQIEQEERKAINFYNKLVNSNCSINFMLLCIENIKADDLYIKMNSRGKQLTPFENFKAELFSKTKNPNFKAELSDKTKNPNFKQSIDGEWLDLIWGWGKVKDSNNEEDKYSEKYSDIFYREILHYIMLNTVLIKNKVKDDNNKVEDNNNRISKNDVNKYYDNNKEKDIENLLTDDENIEDFNLEDYVQNANKKGTKQSNEDKEENLIQSFITDISNTFSGILKINKDGEFSYILKEAKESKKYKQSMFGYEGRLKLFAITKYAQLNKNKEDNNNKKQINENSSIIDINDYFRVINNLIKNSEIDSPFKFYNELYVLNDLKLDDVTSLVKFKEWLIKLKNENTNNNENNVSKTYFKNYIIDEEILKLEIINKAKNNNKDFEKLIYNAEKISLFNSEIQFMFNTLSIDDSKNFENKNGNFKNLTNELINLNNYLQEDGNDKKEREIQILRALLTCVDFSVYPDKYEAKGKEESNTPYVRSYYVFNESHHNNDFRAILRYVSSDSVDKNELQKFFELFVNKDQIDHKIKTQIKGFKRKQENNVLEDFRYYLIQEPCLYKYIEKGRVFKKSNQIYLIHGQNKHDMPNYKLYLLKNVIESEDKNTCEKIVLHNLQNGDSKDTDSYLEVTINSEQYQITTKDITIDNKEYYDVFVNDNVNTCFVGKNKLPISDVESMINWFKGVTKFELKPIE